MTPHGVAKNGSRSVKGAMAALLALLASCSLHRQKDTTECRLEAVRSHPHEPGEYSSDIDRYMETCMAAKGYRLNLAPADCRLDDTYEDPFCYERRPSSSN